MADRRRHTPELIVRKFRVAARRACEIVGLHRSTQYHRLAEADPDLDLRAELRDLAKNHPRRGYRLAHAVLQRRDWCRFTGAKTSRIEPGWP